MATKAGKRNGYLHVPAIGCNCVVHDDYSERMFLDSTVVE